MPKSGQPWVRDFADKSPLFEPFRDTLRVLADRDDWPTPQLYTELVASVCRQRGLDLNPARFAEQVKRPRRAKRGPVALEDLYDGSIALRGEVPCLNASYHDLFNALIFASFPLAKHALHARQFQALKARVAPGMHRLPESRTREQDALTVFDEGGSVVLVSREFFEQWQRDKPWTKVATHDDHTQLWVFGHALLEHVFYGRFELRSCAVVLVKDERTPGLEAELLPWLDERVALLLQDMERFQAPGADGVVRIDAEGELWLGPSLL